ncbi:MAG: DNA mismatch repair endonuclease MutL [Lachnospiraceae bacterium]|nr:DNA mismatch repair endonuclease MutL [Lachnospiraceae bacterium]
METPKIQVLDQDTIGKIAAGEVIERPLSVAKELVENAIDAGATAITVEMKEGGIRLLRVTDNGCGIAAEDVRTAFLEHATSKIRSTLDLLSIRSLGFRGEALPSIAAVSRTELITKTAGSLTGVRILMEGGKELSFEEVGAPEGTTFLVRDLFYNLPARRKFLKSARTEGNAITSLMERLALSHTGISFQLMSDGRSVLRTDGNGRIRDVIYQIYGRDIAENLLPVELQTPLLKLYGYVGKPNYSRGNRDFENYFINGRYVKSTLLQKSIEDAYHSFLMQHQYPFTALMLEVDGKEVDVNIHPQKMALRFQKPEEIYDRVYQALRSALKEKELIPKVFLPLEEKKPAEEKLPPLPEPFEAARVRPLNMQKEHRETVQSILADKGTEPDRELSPAPEFEVAGEKSPEPEESGRLTPEEKPVQTELLFNGNRVEAFSEIEPAAEAEELTGPEEAKKPEEPKAFRILGQVFLTYWLVETGDRLLMVDQHAAHEKVIFERLMKRKAKKERLSQALFPGLTVTLSTHEEQTLNDYLSLFTEAGYEIEPFGGRTFTITAVPADIYGLDEKHNFLEMLDELANDQHRNVTEELYYHIATMSCKAAVKGNQHLTLMEFQALMEQLLSCETPYQCPHGRPTMISLTRYEVEKLFKRVVPS